MLGKIMVDSPERNSRAADRRILAQHRVTSILASIPEGEDPLPRILTALTRELEWDVGVFWCVDEDARVLRSTASCAAAGGVEEYLEDAQRQTIPLGAGLVGRVCAERRARWMRDASADPTYLRRAAAAAAGLRVGVFVPISGPTTCVGVIELMARRDDALDDQLLDALATIGFQIGQFLERRAVDRELAQRDRLSSLVADSVPQIIWLADAAGAVRYYNRRWYEYTGAPVRSLPAPSEGVSHVHPDDLPTLVERGAHALAAGEPSELEVRLRRADGAYRWHLNRSLPIKDEQDRIVMWVGSATDIDDRRRAAERRRFLDRAGALLAGSLDPDTTLRSLADLLVPALADWCVIHVVDDSADTPRRLVVAHVDPAKVAWAEELSRDYPTDPDAPRGVHAVIRTGQPELYPDITDEMVQAAARDARHLALLRQVGFRSALTVPLRARGERRGAISLIHAESGRRYDDEDLAFIHELADRAALAVDNARLYQEAQDAIRVRDDFLSIASHELKTPLTPLQLHLEDLMRRAEENVAALTPEKIIAKIGSVARQVERITALVDGLLDISRITQGRLRVAHEQLDLAAVVRDVVTRFARAASQVGCDLEVDVPATLPALLDPMRVEQILSNLLANALKFGAGAPVAIALHGDGEEARLEVRDHGIGISAEDQARIFERFERAVPQHHFGGFGLGLWITRQLVDALGGSIQVDSALGRGSRFVVRLPRRPPDERG